MPKQTTKVYLQTNFLEPTPEPSPPDIRSTPSKPLRRELPAKTKSISVRMPSERCRCGAEYKIPGLGHSFCETCGWMPS